MNHPISRMTALCSLLVYSWASHASGSGNLFISSEKDSGITVLNGTTLETVSKIGTASRPRHMIFDQDKKRIFVACGDGNAIDIIDVEQLKLVDRIEGIDDPEVIELSPDGKTLYISLEDEGALGVLDLAAFFSARQEEPELTIGEPDDEDDSGDGDESGSDDDDDDDDDDDGEESQSSIPGLEKIPVGLEPEGVLVSPDGSRTYVTSEVANTVHVVDNENKELINNIVVGNRPRRFALSNDGKELWVSNELSASVTILDTETYEIIDTIEFLPPGFRKEDVTPVGIMMTSDGNTTIVALGRANHVAFVDTKSRKIESYTLVGTRAWNAALTKDDKTLYVVNGLSDDISVIDMASKKAVKSVPVGRVPYMILVDD
ncbi:MAG: beta-propeller fold lactonase family protein [Gammaproteobacteria bacterium]|nr:beta-propeller fold lactonase family protein [Gammaproteobacteria bacterium]